MNEKEMDLLCEFFKNGKDLADQMMEPVGEVQFTDLISVCCHILAWVKLKKRQDDATEDFLKHVSYCIEAWIQMIEEAEKMGLREKLNAKKA